MWLEFGFTPFVSIAEGAVDCIVVRVVVRERSEGAGDENVLPPPPVVAPVRPPDDPALDDLVVVSGLVDEVDGLLLSADGGPDFPLTSMEEKLPVRPGAGVEMERCSFLWVLGGAHDAGYGLLREFVVDFLDLEAC